jgi:hypothetical protein
VTECAIGIVAAPLKLTTIGEPDALLNTERLPVNVPAAVGANFTINVTLWPAARVIGRVIPVKVNPLPLIVACEMVTLAVLAVNITGSETLLPTVKLAKFSDALSAASVPTGATPVPLTATFEGELFASLKIVRVPVTGPDTVGVNFTMNDALWPTVRVSGRAGPVSVNPEPAMLACEMITLALLAVNVSGIELLLPSVTFPNPSEVASEVSVPLGATPAPVAATFIGESLASLVMISDPLAGPTVDGANFTVNAAL